MAESGDIFHPDSEPPIKQTPWGVIIAVAIFIGLTILVIYITREKKNEQARDAVVEILDQELETDQKAVQAQRDKVMDLSRQVESLRSRIQSGQEKNGKAAVAEFNQLAAQQRTERDKFKQMAEEYNQKVAKLHDLQQ
jgi:hypothetical protein